jgi:hypothetical protein
MSISLVVFCIIHVEQDSPVRYNVICKAAHPVCSDIDFNGTYFANAPV